MTDSRKDVELPWTGERYLPEVRGNIELEHIHRYLLASRFVAGKRVLDIACGEGYGSALLAQTAASVVGVDIAAAAVDHAGAKYQSRNLSFKTGSCAAIPLPDRCVDVVVSFETIEHHDQHDEMLREIKRVLVPNGMLVISSPDRLEYSDKPGTSNPYHVKELYRSEFESLLGAYFQFHQISGQRIVYGSAILAEDSASHISSFGVNDRVLLPAPGVGRPLYLVAIASDHALPIMESGILEQPIEESDHLQDAFRQIRGLGQTVSERERQLAGLNQAVVERDERINNLEPAILERDHRIRELDDAVSERDVRAAALGQAVAERDAQINGLSLAAAERDARIGALDQILAERDAQIVRLDAAAVERDERIAHLGHALTTRGERIITLDDAVAERDRHVASLDRSVAERDAQIGLLEQTLAERDGQIASLKRAATERDAQLQALAHAAVLSDSRIAALDDAAVDRDGQIEVLKRAFGERDARIAEATRDIAERDRQIARLERTLADFGHWIDQFARELAERTGRIVELGHVVAERLRQIGRLDLELADRDRRIERQGQQIHALLQSHSWRWTRPLRMITRPLRSNPEPSAALVDQVTAPLLTAPDDAVHRIQSSPLFDQIFYLTQYPDVAAAGLDPATHYLLSGWVEHRDPSDRFSTSAYLRDNPDVEEAGINPLLHYIDSGRAEGRPLAIPTGVAFENGRQATPHPAMSAEELDSEVRAVAESGLFDFAYYLAINPDIEPGITDPLRHYCESGWREGRNPSAAFDTHSYLRLNPDVAASGMNPLLHYFVAGRAEGRLLTTRTENRPESSPPVAAPETAVLVDHAAKAELAPDSAAAIERLDAEMEVIANSGMFDADYYLAMNPDIEAEATDALRHYCECGWRQGRNPSDDFDSRAYLDAYSDIKRADINPFWHYVIAGALEGRQGTFDSRVLFEDEALFGKLDCDVRLIAYYSTPDWGRVQRAHNASGGQRLLPHEDLGFYAHTDGMALGKQTLMARRHGIGGWCFELDAAQGPRGDEPLARFLADRTHDIRFCVDIGLSSAAIDERAIAHLQTALGDDRYLRVDGRPLLVMTLPDDAGERAAALSALDAVVAARQTVQPFRIARLNGAVVEEKALATFGLDGILSLPNNLLASETGSFKPFHKNGVYSVPYSAVASQGIARMREPSSPGTTTFHAVTLGRDDTPMSPAHPLTYKRFHLKDYRRWLDAAIEDARARHSLDRRLLFINAWNDWNQGAVLEPDRSGGYSKLNETSRALLGMTSGLVLPKVSVIVPNYNHAKYLPRRLDSIYRQTYRNFEVLLLDDCSTDESRAVLADYAERHRECTSTLFNVENSGGVFRQWAKGIKAATGDLIWVAESDDYCDENFLEELVRCFKDEAVMLAYSKVEFVRANEEVIPNEFLHHVRDLSCKWKWQRSHVNSAHQEVREALGIVNTIPNASGAIFRRPVDMPLLDDEAWLSMAVVGDWLFYLHVIRGGKVAYSAETTNYFRRYESSTAASTYHKEKFYRELGMAARTVQMLYDVPESAIVAGRRRSKELYDHFCATSVEEFDRWFDQPAAPGVGHARTPNILISTMAFYPGGAEILPIRFANELKRTGHSVLLLSVGLTEREDGVRRMLRRDVPVIETADIEETKAMIRDFGIEVLNSHQWHVQKYPALVPDVFHDLKAHVASLHGMIEHGHAFGVTPDELRVAHENVSTWVYTADKNLRPFIEQGLYAKNSTRFTKLPNGMEPPTIRPISRQAIGLPDDAFVLCCVSRAIPDKGWTEAIEAVRLAREKSERDIRLILVGNGPVYEDLRRTEVPEFVHLAGFSDNSVGYYAAADIGIMLTKFPSESFPLTIVDCLFAGKPYISCNVGEILNMLTDGDEVAGEVFSLVDWQVPVVDVAETIADYSMDIDRYMNARAIVPRLVTRYRIDHVVESYLAVFRAAMRVREAPHLVEPELAVLTA